jgi:hypothetical protein
MGAPSTPRTTVLPRPSRLLDRRLPLRSGQSLHPAALPIDRALLHEASTRVHAIHPSGLPLACGRPDGTGRPWAFPRASHPADQEPNDARRGGDRPSSTNLKQRSTTSAEHPILRVYSLRATSRRTVHSGRLRLAATTRSRPREGTSASTRSALVRGFRARLAGRGFRLGRQRRRVPRGRPRR